MLRVLRCLTIVMRGVKRSLSSRLASEATLALLLATATFANAQNPSANLTTGQWQGKLEGGTTGRVILQVQPGKDGALQGIVYLLDADNAEWPRATSALLAQGADVSFRIPNIEASFSGKLTAEQIAGTWTEHKTVAPLRLAHVTGDAAWVPPVSSKEMALDADPAFEVATIRPADPDEKSSGFQLRGNRVHVLNEPLEMVVTFAYGIQKRQLIDAPGWWRSEYWVIDGVPDAPGAPNLAQMRTMCRKLLAERFGLVMKEEQREIPVYAIEPGNGAPTMTRSVANPNGPPDSTGNFGRIADVRFTNITMDEFANTLGFTTDRPVVNHTGLTGRWDFRLHWTSQDVPETDAPDQPPMLSTAIRDQLGLRLDSQKAPAQVFVVMHVERPTAN